MYGDIALNIVRNRVVFGVILIIHCLIKIKLINFNRVPKKVKRTKSCFTDIQIYEGIGGVGVM